MGILFELQMSNFPNFLISKTDFPHADIYAHSGAVFCILHIRFIHKRTKTDALNDDKSLALSNDIGMMGIALPADAFLFGRRGPVCRTPPHLPAWTPHGTFHDFKTETVLSNSWAVTRYFFS